MAGQRSTNNTRFKGDMGFAKSAVKQVVMKRPDRPGYVKKEKNGRKD